MSFGQKLKELRKRACMTQDDLAKKLRVAKSTISMYEQGERAPNMEMLSAIAECFNVSVDFLVGKNVTENEKLAAKNDSEQEVVVYHRNGKIIKKRLSKQHLDIIVAMLHTLPDGDEDI